MKPFFAIITLFASISTFASDYSGKLVLYCKSLPAGQKVHSAQSVVVNGNEIRLMEFNPATRKVELVDTIPTAECTIAAEQSYSL